ncbi:transmembrane protein 272-like [Anoplopoma fimbria]|uniref:transmembrane protein 272-like n=1 Tax=Anoplopoma fimbria TaxID=229290 RepID=UPI0023ED4648|nr:transmembrane protein 272-like [Anoplopoma fimbria]
MSESEGPQRIFRPPAVTLVCTQVIMGIMPLAQLVVGAVYQNDCPKQPYIPIYLMVMGVVSLVLTVLSLLPCCARFEIQSMAWSCLVALFFFCWFTAGNVWIYSIYEPSYNQTASSMDTYCNKTLYLFAFWTTNLFYILLGFMILMSCCTCFLVG